MAFKNLMKVIENKKAESGTFEQRFLTKWEQALLKIDKERQQTNPPKYFRPSSIWGCKRMLYFWHKGFEPDDTPNDVTMIGIQQSGTDRHARIQEVLKYIEGLEILDVEEVVKEAKQKGINTEFLGWNKDKTEARCINHDLHLYFQSDGVFKFENKECLLEIKTESTYTFRNRIAPKEEHIQQATCYALGLGIDYVLFFYEDRNFTHHKLFLTKITEEMKRDIKAKINEVLQYLETDTIPTKELDKCTYCKFKKVCKTN